MTTDAARPAVADDRGADANHHPEYAMTITIKNRYTDADIYVAAEATTMRQAVIAARAAGADLSDAVLSDAVLSGAVLPSADAIWQGGHVARDPPR